MNFLSTVIAPSFFNAPAGSGRLTMMILLTTAVGIALFIGFLFAPTRARRPIVATFTFLAGLFWVLVYFWPRPDAREAGDLPNGTVESVGFWLADAIPIVGTIANILTQFLLGLGIYSVLRIHLSRLTKKQKDWQFSLALLVSMLAMIFFGYWDFILQQRGQDTNFPDPSWVGRDMLFDGMLQQMDAAMFSLIAFFILSAAYRAFRVRSLEATILLSTALVVMLSLMGAVEYGSSYLVDQITGENPGSLLNNLKLTEIYGWIRNNLQTPSIRALEFGVGIGALAMGLRLWLGLERGGVST